MNWDRWLETEKDTFWYLLRLKKLHKMMHKSIMSVRIAFNIYEAYKLHKMKNCIAEIYKWLRGVLF
jgi:hypothetical protein